MKNTPPVFLSVTSRQPQYAFQLRWIMPTTRPVIRGLPPETSFLPPRFFSVEEEEEEEEAAADAGV